MRNSLGFMLSESQRSLCSQMSSREMCNVSTRGCSFKGRNAVPVFCPAGREQMCTTVVRFVLCHRDETRSSPDPHHKLPFLSQSVEPIFTEGVTYILQRVSVQSSLTFIQLNLFLKRFICVLLCTWDRANYHQKSSHQVVLGVNMSKISYLGSDSQSLNPHWLLSCVEPN